MLIASERIADTAIRAADEAGHAADRRFSLGQIDGFCPFNELSAGHPATTPSDRLTGSTMTYTSGTTGRPKGVRRSLYPMAPEVASSQQALFLSLFGIFPGQPGVHLCVAPLYHTAVINFARNHLHLGHTIVLMDR